MRRGADGRAGQQPAATAYLVSEAALISNNADQLTEGACATLTKSPPLLTAFYPAGGAVLDFPFTTVNWGGTSAGGKTRSQYEADFYHWLTSRAAVALLEPELRPPHCGKLSKPRQASPPPFPAAGQRTCRRKRR